MLNTIEEIKEILSNLEFDEYGFTNLQFYLHTVDGGKWKDTDSLSCLNKFKYRIKPKPKQKEYQPYSEVKREWLGKMEVLSFIQMYSLTVGDIAKYHNWLKKRIHSHFTMFEEWHEFLTQPFKPEMITEYFEGWEITRDANIIFYRNGEQSICWDKSIPNCMTVCGTEEDQYGKDFPTPYTLDHFIIFCVYAGITLKWKNE